MQNLPLDLRVVLENPLPFYLHSAGEDRPRTKKCWAEMDRPSLGRRSTKTSPANSPIIGAACFDSIVSLTNKDAARGKMDWTSMLGPGGD